MQRRASIAIIMAGLIVSVGIGSSWAGPPPPPNPTASDSNFNTAGGTGALDSTGAPSFDNTAFGRNALTENTIGHSNTATGTDALRDNTTGHDNTATGFGALLRNKDGVYNIATGSQALFSNTTGAYNTASGYAALFSNKEGAVNTASGVGALLSNTTGTFNTASGVQALQNNTTGSGNIALGYLAGTNLTTGSYNIDIGSTGVAGEDRTIRLGSPGHSRTFIAGINGAPVSGNMVVVDANGQLGIPVSSARYKQDIRNIGSQSQKLGHLRPVTFHYKSAPQAPVQYGLIAEEVARVYPELVTRDSAGQIESLQYHQLIPLLLNEVQHQHQQYQHQQQELAAVQAQNARLEATLAQMQVQVATLVALMTKSQGSQALASR